PHGVRARIVCFEGCAAGEAPPWGCGCFPLRESGVHKAFEPQLKLNGRSAAMAADTALRHSGEESLLGAGRLSSPTGRQFGAPRATSSANERARAQAVNAVAQPSEPYLRVSREMADDRKASAKGYFCPCHTDPEMYHSTSHADYKAYPSDALPRPQLKPLERKVVFENRDFMSEYKKNFLGRVPQYLPIPAAAPAVKVRHVDPSTYTTTCRAAYTDPRGQH
ncbi:microtubule-associated protein, partial [Trypanosoma conorhini]